MDMHAGVLFLEDRSSPVQPCPVSQQARPGMAWHGRTGRTGPGRERRMNADEFAVHPIRALTVDRSTRSPLMIDKVDPHSYLVLSAPSSTFATAFLPFSLPSLSLGQDSTRPVLTTLKDRSGTSTPTKGRHRHVLPVTTLKINLGGSISHDKTTPDPRICFRRPGLVCFIITDWPAVHQLHT